MSILYFKISDNFLCEKKAKNINWNDKLKMNQSTIFFEHLTEMYLFIQPILFFHQNSSLWKVLITNFYPIPNFLLLFTLLPCL